MRVKKQAVLDCDDQLAATCLSTHAHFFPRAIVTRKVGHADLVLVSYQGSLIDYKSLCAAVTLCSTLVNIQTQTDQLI